ncbi:MAG: hypothetical protein ACRD0U_10780 [Acidimicrobiales bacterium]
MADSFGVPTDGDTLVEVLADFAAEGYTANFTITDRGTIRCPNGGHEHQPEEMELHGWRRLEGASDPADMMAVLALVCPRCGTKGSAVAHFGPDSTPGEVAVIRAVEDHRLGH